MHVRSKQGGQEGMHEPRLARGEGVEIGDEEKLKRKDSDGRRDAVAVGGAQQNSSAL